jgi:S-adenosylmethionine:tRNA ribosyltransferase-isomerase
VANDRWYHDLRISHLNLEDFDYSLPEELIAQQPTEERAASRMLVVDRTTGLLKDAAFRNLPHFLQPGDVLVVNNSRVLPARLFGRRTGSFAQPVGKRNPEHSKHLTSPIEVLLVRQLDERTWEALVKPGRKVRTGEAIIFGETSNEEAPHEEREAAVLQAEVIGRGDYGLRVLRFQEGLSVPQMLEKVGHVPSPPYINRPDAGPGTLPDDLRAKSRLRRRTHGRIAL